jgi:hypothetical protein
MRLEGRTRANFQKAAKRTHFGDGQGCSLKMKQSLFIKQFLTVHDMINSADSRVCNLNVTEEI